MKILILQGHPDPQEKHFGHALAGAYAEGAREAGHELDLLNVAELNFPLLHSQKDWKENEPPGPITEAQKRIRAADHIALFYPLWLGTMPARLKAFFEQVFRPEYAIHMDAQTGHWERLLKGKSARVVVTMGMPGFAYRFFYRAHSLKSLERNILKFVGIRPVRETVIGLVESPKHNHDRDLERMRRLGARGS